MNTKQSKLPLLATVFLGAFVAFLATSCSSDGSRKHAEAGHDHNDHEHAASESDHHEHNDSDSHDDEKAEGGPNGGRLITTVDPAVEFIVEEERIVRILFLDEKRVIVPPTNQIVSLIGGDRTKPTLLTFSQKGQGLSSDKALPEGNIVPVVLQIQMSPATETVREKFNVNLSECPTCDYQEYACVCHDESDH